VLSGFLNISALLTIYQIYKTQKKLLFSLFLFLQLTALILTFSRAGMLGLFLGVLIFFILMKVNRYETKKAFLFFLSVVFIIFSLFSKMILERGVFGSSFQSSKSKELNYQSDNLRDNLSQTSINIIKKHPFFGVGFRNFLIKKDEFTEKKIERANVHNIYLLIGSEMGLISLSIFLVLIFFVFINLSKYRPTPFSIILVCVLISFLIIGFFDHYPISSFFGKIVMFTNLAFLNFDIQTNKLLSSSQKAFLYQ
jgi:O-antigen ligase